MMLTKENKLCIFSIRHGVTLSFFRPKMTVTGVTGMTVSDRIFQINTDQPCHSSHYYLSRGHFQTFPLVFIQYPSVITFISIFDLFILKTLKFVKKVSSTRMKL